MRIRPILLILAVVVMLTACLVTPTPPATPTLPVEGTPTPIEIAPTPTQAPVSTPTPQVVQLPGGNAYKKYAGPPLMTIEQEKSYNATIRTSQGNITISLFASETPITVNNFVFLAREGFYDGLSFHRVINDFMIQGGDPRGDGAGGPGYRFADEPVNRSYNRGIVAMANSGPDTNGSQFFIVHGTDVGLAPNYTIFGEVTRGMETVDAIASSPVQPNAFGELSSPINPITIETIEITEGR